MSRQSKARALPCGPSGNEANPDVRRLTSGLIYPKPDRTCPVGTCPAGSLRRSGSTIMPDRRQRCAHASPCIPTRYTPSPIGRSNERRTERVAEHVSARTRPWPRPDIPGTRLRPPPYRRFSCVREESPAARTGAATLIGRGYALPSDGAVRRRAQARGG